MVHKKETEISPQALVKKGAELGRGVKIGAGAMIGQHVVLGDYVEVAPYAIISGKTSIGAHSKISSFATIGATPQDLKYHGEEAELICGERNQFREYSNVSIGTEGGGGVTRIGSDNLFMVYSHVAHDCIIGNHCILANGVSLAGHIEVGDRAVIGGHAACHQFIRIGSLAMIAGGAMVVQDVPPFCIVQGDHAVPRGINLLGLKRAALSASEATNIKKMYKILFMSDLSLERAIQTITETIESSPYKIEFTTFLEQTKRGICRKTSPSQ